MRGARPVPIISRVQRRDTRKQNAAPPKSRSAQNTRLHHDTLHYSHVEGLRSAATCLHLVRPSVSNPDRDRHLSRRLPPSARRQRINWSLHGLCRSPSCTSQKKPTASWVALSPPY